MDLRDYQYDAIQAVLAARDEGLLTPCVVIPTGGGKTPVIASLAAKFAGAGQRVLVLSHVKEILAQNAATIEKFTGGIPVGVHSAGLGRRDTREPIIVGGVHSVFHRSEELGTFDAVLIDEAHLVRGNGEGRYHSILRHLRSVNPALFVVGFTATPYRLDCGPIVGPSRLFAEIVYEAKINDLIEQGYLTRPVTYAPAGEIKTDGVAIRAGEFAPDQLEAAAIDRNLIATACREIAARTSIRRKILVFCCGRRHAYAVAAELGRLGLGQGFGQFATACPVVLGDTPKEERNAIVREFREGDLRCVVNVNVLTTGFDSPNIDAVAILRPTTSPGLYYQMVGRGFRVCPGKTNFLVLDFGGNYRHGTIDDLKPPQPQNTGGEKRESIFPCPKCARVQDWTRTIRCPACGWERPVEERKPRHDTTPSQLPLFGPTDRCTHRVLSVRYSKYWAKSARPGQQPPTLRVDYVTDAGVFSEWIGIEHPGRRRYHSRRWWAKRHVHGYHARFPRSVDEALASVCDLKKPTQIVVERRENSKFFNVVDAIF